MTNGEQGRADGEEKDDMKNMPQDAGELRSKVLAVRLA